MTKKNTDTQIIEEVTEPEIFETPEGFVPAVFIGKGVQRRGTGYFLPSVHSFWIPVDVNGFFMDVTDDDGNYVDPTENPEYLTRQVYELFVGEVAMLPGPEMDAASWQTAVDLGYFAKASFYKQIQQWFEEGLNAREVREKIIELGGLIGEPKVAVETVYTGG